MRNEPSDIRLWPTFLLRLPPCWDWVIDLLDLMIEVHTSPALGKFDLASQCLSGIAALKVYVSMEFADFFLGQSWGL